MGLLMLLGLVIMYAIGPQRAHVLNVAYGTDNYTSTYFFVKQGLSLALAVVSFTLFAKLPISIIRKYQSKLLMVAFAMSGVLAVAGFLQLGIATCTLGACRWFDLGPLGSLQPAELLKFALLIFMASFLGARYQQGKINDRDATILPMLGLLGFAIFFVIVLQKDMGTGIALVAIVSTMLLASGLNKKVGITLITALLAAGVLLIVTAPHRMERIATFFAGDSTSTEGDNYHIAHAKIAIGSGGFLGVGIGNSVQATGYLPEVINDSVFAVMGETFGFVGLVAILAIFTALLLRILRVADRLNDMPMRLIAIGVFGWLGAHVVLNVAAMTGIFPLTGITLPLLSFGGTSMVFIAGALGLVFQLSSFTTNEYALERKRYEDSRSGRGLGRPRYASSSRT